MRYLPLILCLLVTACDGEKNKANEAPEVRRRASSPERPAESEDERRDRLELKRRTNLIDAARAKDPELARLLDAYETEIRQHGISLTPDSKNAADAAARFAEHFPEAGLAWAMQYIDQPPWEEFIKALYDIDPDAAFRNLDSLPAEYKLYYLLALTPLLERGQLPELIGFLDDRKKTESIPRPDLQIIFLILGRRDADTGWQLTHEQMNDVSLPRYLTGLISLNQGEAFPVHLLNNVPPGPERVELVKEANKALSGELPQTNLAAWLATQPLTADYLEVYQRLAANPELADHLREKAVGWVSAVEQAK